MHILDVVTFMHISDVVIFMHILDAVIVFSLRYVQSLVSVECSFSPCWVQSMVAHQCVTQQTCLLHGKADMSGV